MVLGLRPGRRTVLTHEPHLVSVVYERHIQDEASENEQHRVDVLQLRVLNDGRNDQVGGYNQNQYGNDERHLDESVDH